APAARHPPLSTRVPYTTLFRSLRDVGPVALGLRRQLTVAFVADQLEPRVPRRERAMNSGRASTPSACADLDDESEGVEARPLFIDRKSTRLNSSHVALSYAVFC